VIAIYCWDHRRSGVRSSEAYNGLEPHRGKLETAQGKIKEKWGKLTDNDLAQIDGRREELEGMIQQRYGLAKDMVRKDVDAWLKSQP